MRKTGDDTLCFIRTVKGCKMRRRLFDTETVNVTVLGDHAYELFGDRVTAQHKFSSLILLSLLA